jgi:hypothetical protein
MIKLLPFLFETIDSNVVINELHKASQGPSYVWKANQPEKLYSDNKEKFDQLLANASEFRYLGSGYEGSAFSLGTTVLKLTLSPDRSDFAMTQLFGMNKSGKHLPMIYDQGSLNGEEVYYSVLELFETIPKGWEEYIHSIILQAARFGFLKQPVAKFVSVVKKSFPVKDITAFLRLQDNWLSLLYKDVAKLVKSNIDDFKVDNVGIRRVGGEGYLVFFD